MKKILLLLALTVLLVPGNASAYDQLTVHMTDGTQVDVVLTDAMSISFTATELVASDEGVDVKVNRNEISHFVHSTASGIADVASGESAFKHTGNSLVFTNLPQGSQVIVCNIAGVVLEQIQTAGSFTLSLQGYAPGAYVVTVNNVSYKIAVK